MKWVYSVIFLFVVSYVSAQPDLVGLTELQMRIELNRYEQFEIFTTTELKDGGKMVEVWLKDNKSDPVNNFIINIGRNGVVSGISASISLSFLSEKIRLLNSMRIQKVLNDPECQLCWVGLQKMYSIIIEKDSFSNIEMLLE
ncbi:MAG: hypothetical protein KBE91_07810 [Bacteroidia bacterium]|nr:hypothetical protein [Bacteroidia bacterium]